MTDAATIRVAHKSAEQCGYGFVIGDEVIGCTVCYLADALERAERVVAIARGGCHTGCSAKPYGHIDECGLGQTIAAYDTTRADKSRTTLRREAAQRGEEPPEFDGADTVRPDEAAGIEAVRRYRRERKNQHKAKQEGE